MPGCQRPERSRPGPLERQSMVRFQRNREAGDVPDRCGALKGSPVAAAATRGEGWEAATGGPVLAVRQPSNETAPDLLPGAVTFRLTG